MSVSMNLEAIRNHDFENDGPLKIKYGEFTRFYNRDGYAIGKIRKGGVAKITGLTGRVIRDNYYGQDNVIVYIETKDGLQFTDGLMPRDFYTLGHVVTKA